MQGVRMCGKGDGEHVVGELQGVVRYSKERGSECECFGGGAKRCISIVMQVDYRMGGGGEGVEKVAKGCENH